MISRIGMVTIGAPEPAAVEDCYTGRLGYETVERGDIGAALAASWGAPDMDGRPYVLMRPESGKDVFIRVVHIDPVPHYRPMTTTGWNAFEIIVDDVYALNERLADGPFEIMGQARPLGGRGTIHAMQVRGPADEVLYLTCERGDRAASHLPTPHSFVDRPFIVVLAGPDADALRSFYVDRLGMRADRDLTFNIKMIARAQGLPEDHVFPLRMAAAAERGNMIEIDGYPETAPRRKRVDGQLPPGNAMVTFSTDDLDAAAVDFVAAPVRDGTLAYGGRRSAAFVGPAGEMTELIEDPRERRGQQEE